MDLREKIKMKVAMSYPQIHWTPCDMPEVIKQIKVTPDTIIATTDYYNVFTDDGIEHERVYREYYKDSGWRWVNSYADRDHRYIDDSKVVAFIKAL
jgi:hypothetical protein|nr:MAG: hypothetical protein [Bacteriophage sp.]